MYGMSEILFSTASEVTDDGTPARIPTTIHQGILRGENDKQNNRI
jgi:hypothetical protein